MGERRFDELEGALLDLAPRLELPSDPDLATQVRRAIGSERVRSPRRWLPRLQPALGAAAAVVALVAAVLIFSPTTREAVADWIGLDGVRITAGDPPAGIAEDLLLGERVTREEAQDRAGFDLKGLAALGKPNEVYIQEDRPGARVSFVYEASGELPRTEETRVGALFSQFQATELDVIVKKTAAGATVRAVDVAGAPGYWLARGPHVVEYVDPEGRVGADQVRLAGNTLLWQVDGVVYRIESALDREAAIALAESLR